MSITPQSGTGGGALKIDMFQVLYCIEMEKYIQFGIQRYQKYVLYVKTLQIKVDEAEH